MEAIYYSNRIRRDDGRKGGRERGKEGWREGGKAMVEDEVDLRAGGTILCGRKDTIFRRDVLIGNDEIDLTRET